MATSYIRTAQSQLSPGYTQQIRALQGQIKPINQSYAAQFNALQGQQQAGFQNVLEDSNSRGILRSTIPVYGQAQVAADITGQRGQLAAQNAKDIGGIYKDIGGLQVDQASAIAQLANALQGNFIQQQQLQNQIAQSNREYALQQQALAGGYL
jgi:hypothetical protein